MTRTWKPGDAVALRGVYDRHISHIQSAIVVQDHPDEVVLAILPGAECSAPEGYMEKKHGTTGGWDRWGIYQQGDWKMQKYIWHTNRLLMLLRPEKYYASYYLWRANNNEFLCYYINFQLPFWRSAIGFDTFDLELDIVVKPTYEWRWKDLEDYQRGMDCGILRKEWIQEINAVQPEVFGNLEKRNYPFDGFWLTWMPDPHWLPPTLPENWDKI